MRKTFAFIPALLALSAALFAEVTVKDLGGGSAEVTFFYGNPRASEVVVAGDFTDWQNAAWPMEKTERGFTLTRTFKTTDVLRYKFISDGNWTTDLKAPEFVDDGFGGKNGQVTIADMIGGDDAGAGKAKINFISWSMIGVQGNYLTQSVSDPSKKGMDLDSVTLGFKSYNKFAGNFLPNCPIYIEIALAETEMEDAGHQGNGGNRRNYLFKNNSFNQPTVSWEQGFKNFASGLLTNPISYLAQTNNNIDTSDFSSGPGTNPFLGHLKFGFNTPYIKYYAGFNYAKADTRDAITWTTIGSNFDAGYDHAGGFHVFSLGDKPATAFQEATGLNLDVGFAPNKSADRRGYKYGYWGWADISGDTWAVDFQTNGMYDGDYAFFDPIEHDFILGGKAKFDNFSFALQGLLATHQKSSADIIKDNVGEGAKYASQAMGAAPDSLSQTFGHSTDVFYRDTDLGLQKLAANAQVGYNDSFFGANLEYRMRGAQASMLFVREDQDNGTFDLSEQLGVLNSQRIAFNGYINPIDMLRIDLGFSAEMPLEFLRKSDEIVQKWAEHSGVWDSWYASRCADDMAPLFGVVGGAEFAIKPAITVNITDGLTLGAYADMYVNTYRIEKHSFGEKYIGDKYSASDSSFLFKFAGLSLGMKLDADAVKGVNVFYGLDNSNSARLFNTLVGQVEFKYGFKATLGFGVKTIKGTEAGDAFNEDENNVFAFALGLSRQFQSFKKPTIYAQFVFNTDPFNGFGSGQEQLRMDRANVGSYWVDGVMQGQGDSATGQRSPDAVDWYDGRAALRLGIRWDI